MNQKPNSYLFHLALAALLAILARCREESFLALAGPPFRPPRRPRATAAGFFSVPSATASTTALAIWLKSLLVRLGMESI